jgi:hypothetical protein
MNGCSSAVNEGSSAVNEGSSAVKEGSSVGVDSSVGAAWFSLEGTRAGEHVCTAGELGERAVGGELGERGGELGERGGELGERGGELGGALGSTLGGGGRRGSLNSSSRR